MTVTYQGLDCVLDADTEQYMAYQMALQAEVVWTDQMAYGYYTIYFGCAFIVVSFLKHVYDNIKDRQYAKGHSFDNWFSQLLDILTSYGRYVGYKQVPAKLAYFTSLPPSLGSSLFLFCSSLYMLLYLFVPHFWLRSCAGFGSPPLAVRGGLMATALTPFIYILGGKANFVTLVTGISYEKLNYIHQYLGVAALFLSLVHTIPFIHQPLAEGGLARLRELYNADLLYRNGIPPLVLLFLLCTLSKYRIRKIFYEGFWHVHWILGLGYFATLTWHVYGLLESDHYMWAALAFWAVQVIYRLIVRTCFKPNALFLRPTEASLFKLPGSNAYEVRVKNRGITWKPGQHVYLRFTSRILDNHPFSVCNLPDTKEDELKFIIVPKKGLTRVLYNKLDQSLKEKVFIDGPYGGCSRDHNSFDNVILLATGSGISATLPFLIDLSKNIASGANKVTKQIHFVWIVRHRDDIKWFESELQSALECNCVSLEIFVSADGPSEDKLGLELAIMKEESDIQTTQKVSDIEELIENESAISNIKYFKPDVTRLIQEYSYSLGKRNFVCCSGSDLMRFQVCSQISSLQPLIFNKDYFGGHVDEIFLHTENFGW